MEELIAAIKENTAANQAQLAALNRLLAIEEAKVNQSDWMTAEEVAKELKIPLSATNYHRRKIILTAKRYGIRYSKNKPTVYWREDIMEFSRKLKEGKAVLLSPA